jgi:hypothetical protein
MRDVESFTEFLDAYSEIDTQSGAARAIGRAISTSERWLKQSRREAMDKPDGPSLYRFAYRDLGTAYLHEHLKAIRKALIGEIERSMLVRARSGDYAFTLYQGRRQPRLDYDLAELLGLPAEQVLMRDRDGNVVFEMEYRPPSNELIAMALQANHKAYQKRLAVEHNHQGGVMIAHSIATPRVALPPQPVQVIEDATVAEAGIYEDILGPELAADDPERAAPEPEPTAAPAPVSDLQRDLLERARQKGAIRG